jgi:hypothetical protein
LKGKKPLQYCAAAGEESIPPPSHPSHPKPDSQFPMPFVCCAPNPNWLPAAHSHSDLGSQKHRERERERERDRGWNKLQFIGASNQAAGSSATGRSHNVDRQKIDWLFKLPLPLFKTQSRECKFLPAPIYNYLLLPCSRGVLSRLGLLVNRITIAEIEK